MWSDWLVFCDCGFSLSALRCPLSVATVLLGFLLPWTWGTSSRLPQHSCCSWPRTWVSPLCRSPLLHHPATTSHSCATVHILEAAGEKKQTKANEQTKILVVKTTVIRFWSCVLCLEICINQPVLTPMSVVNWRISWKPDELGRLSSGGGDWPAVWLGHLTSLPCGLSSSSRLAWAQWCGYWMVLRTARECQSQCTRTFQISASSQLLWSLGQS